ncbi:Crp/Fnr family transcriptional regulator [Desulfosporosinus sp. PR]|uniref:Crp/Fnr family transcriptional regulator n=1 Tax=Candidatus Desulfosporosinus nitrosoreducens TaxID=3401928 RepID=UPI0027EE4678|nr:Crp/Fnr family transcriptional regulator [Desulfosporosinus sp. PR]MDQ7093688.1 Crp/Fnr family transcriptional regulator [Desulfosporosinus sp. PR]
MSLALEQFPLFHGLSPELLTQWGKFFRERRFTKRQLLEFSPDCLEPIYFVRSGRIKISYLSEDGKEFTVACLSPGDVYSVHSLASATALENSVVIYLGMDKFRPLLEECPELSLRLIRLLGNLLKDTNDVILDLAFREVSVRLAHVILREGHPANKQQVIVKLPSFLDFTHEQLAALIGTTRQTVNEILKRWERQGIVALKRGKVAVLNWELLNDKGNLFS